MTRPNASTTNLSSRREILLERTQVLVLLGRRLVSAVTELGRGIDPLEIDLLGSASAGLCEHGLAESHDSLLDTWDGTLEHDKVGVDGAVADETTHPVKCQYRCIEEGVTGKHTA